MGVKGDAVALLVPCTVGIINSNETGLNGWQELLKGIGCVSKSHIHAILGSQCKEQFHTRLFDAGGIGSDAIT